MKENTQKSEPKNDRFAKLFEQDDWQVLITIEADSEEELLVLRVRTDIEGIMVTKEFAFQEKAKRDLMFKEFDTEKAKEVRTDLLTLLEPVSEPVSESELKIMVQKGALSDGSEISIENMPNYHTKPDGE